MGRPLSNRTPNFLLAALLGICCAVVAQPGIVRADAWDTARAGIAAKERRQFPQAIRLIEEALRRGRFSAEQKGMLLYHRGVSYNALGIRDKAFSDFDAAIRLLPQFPNSYVNRGLIWVYRREYERALEDFLYALRLAPDEPAISNNLGGVYLMKGDLVQALESYDRAIRLKPDYADAYFNRAEVFVAAGEYARAMADYDQAIRLSPTLAEAIRNRGLLHLKLGAIDKAIADFGIAIRLRPADAALLTNRATAWVLIGKYDEAFVDFDRALQIEPSKPEIYLGRGRSRLFAGDVSASIDDFITAVRLRPDDPNPAIWLHIARVHSGVDDRQELADNAAGVVGATWPKALLDLYLGKLDADGVRSAAAEGSPKDRARRKCEAEFYLAEFAVHNGELSKGRRLLEEVSSQCRQYSALYSAAQAELRFALQ